MKILSAFFSLFLFSGFIQASSSDPTTNGFVLSDSVWDVLEIPVCWENPNAAPSIELSWVVDAVERTWESESNVRFTGWEACSADSSGIRILINDQGPHVKRLGKYLDGYVNGMVLNFTYENWSTSCQSRRQYCSEVIAVHEFGHALGLAHEQNREDTPDTCTDDPQGTTGDFIVGAWDLHSVMNYCNPEWNGAGNLSNTDIQTVQLFYGAPSGDLELAEACSIVASSDDGNIPENTIDGDLETRWSANGNGQWIEFGLCDTRPIKRVDIAWHKGDQRSSIFAIESNLNNGAWLSEYSAVSTGATLEMESYPVNSGDANAVRIVGFGNTSNTWTSITEAQVFVAAESTEVQLLEPTNFAVSEYSSTSFLLTWDDNSVGEDGYIIEVSVNGSSYYQIIGNIVENSVEYLHEGLYPDTLYRYRVMSFSGEERSVYAEAERRSVSATAEILPVSIIATSHDGNVPENVRDNDLQTRWSAKGAGEWIEFDLGKVYYTELIQAAWHKGDQRTAKFEIRSSVDGDQWWLEAVGETDGTSLELEGLAETDYFQIRARYIRIVGNGNSLSTWNSISEVKLFGFPENP